MTIDILALANAAASTAVNMTEASTGGGGGDYVPPAEGWALARLVAYIEGGDHEKSVGAGKPKVIKPQVKLIFELSGRNHEPKKLDDGTLLPHRITEDFNAGKNYGGLNEKSGLYKLFRRMNYEGTATHFSQLLGKPFIVFIRHDVKGEGATKRTYVSLRDDAGEYQVKAPRNEDVLTGTMTAIDVPPAVSALRLFVWNSPASSIKLMWDTLFIEGMYPERKDKSGAVTAAAKSKNVLQDWCKAALNFRNSALDDMLQSGGVTMDLGAAGKPQAAPAAAATPSSPTDTAPTATPATTTSPSNAASSDPLSNV